jgi:hypothetical protein
MTAQDKFLSTLIVPIPYTSCSNHLESQAPGPLKVNSSGNLLLINLKVMKSKELIGIDVFTLAVSYHFMVENNPVGFAKLFETCCHFVLDED